MIGRGRDAVARWLVRCALTLATDDGGARILHAAATVWRQEVRDALEKDRGPNRERPL